MNQETHPQSDPSGSTFGLSGNVETPAPAPNSNPGLDHLLTTAPRIQFEGREVPALGGIPLLRKIGQGGMGAVYYGIHPRLRQEVAVKVLPFPLIAQDPVVIERFYREAQIAARVKSAHLVTVLDVNEEAGLFYLVMEYVAGVSAGSYVAGMLKTKGRGMNEADALDLCIAASEGLAVAHREGVIHRDLKPDNILVPRMKNEAELDFTGAKIADLGLARDEGSGNSLTNTYAAMGSLGYMPPEQAMDAKSVRKPGDVFSMGATLYALLAGKPPFKGANSTAVLLDTLQGQQEPLRNLRPEVSENTARLVDKCLAKEPEKRFEDGEALLEALRACRSLMNAPVDRSAPTVPAAVPVPASVAGTPALTLMQPDSLALAPMTPPHGSLELTPIVNNAVNAPAAQPAPKPAAPKPARKPAAPKEASAPEAEAEATPASKAKLYVIAGVAAAVLLLAGVIGLYLNGVRKDRAFLALRDKVLTDNKPALKASGAELNVAKSGLDAFLKENGHRDASLLVPVRDLRNDLSKRQEALDARAAAFNEIVQKADRTRSTDPAKALELLKQAQAAGKFDAESGYPDINASVAPTVTERIEKVELAIREAASRAKAIDENYAKTMEGGAAAFEKKEYEAAELAYKHALELKPNDAPAKEALDKIAEARKKDADDAALAEGSERRKAILAAIEKAIEAQRIENWDAMAEVLEPLQKESIPDAALKEKYQGLLKIAQTERKTRQEAKKLIEEGVQQLADKKYEDALKSFKESIALWPDARLDDRVKNGMAEAQAALAGVAAVKEPVREDREAKTEVAAQPPKKEQGNPPPNVTENFKRNMADGDRALRQRRYQEAITAYEACLKEVPGDPRASDLLEQAKYALKTGDGTKINFPPGPEGGPGGNGPGPGGDRRPPRPGR